MLVDYVCQAARVDVYPVCGTFLIEAWIMSGLSPLQPSDLGSLAENVSPCIVAARFLGSTCSSCLPLLLRIMSISLG